MGYDKIDDGAGRWCHCSTHIEWHRTASLRPKAVQSSFGDRSGPPHPPTPPPPEVMVHGVSDQVQFTKFAHSNDFCVQ